MANFNIKSLSKYPNFLLRFDFAEEMCFHDVTRSVMDRAAFEKQRAAKVKAAPSGFHPNYEVYVKARTDLPRSRFYGLYYMVPPGATAKVAVVSDAMRRMNVGEDGMPLFIDAVERAHLAAGLKAGIRSPVMPEFSGEPRMRKTTPDYFIYFRKEDSRAWLLPSHLWSMVEWECPVEAGAFG